VPLNQKSQHFKDAGIERVYTYYEFQVRESLKGNITESIIFVRTLGGTTLGGQSEVISGNAQLEIGKQVVLLLGEKSYDQSFEIFGLRNGVLSFASDGETLTGAIITGASLGHNLGSLWNNNSKKKSHDDTANGKKWTLKSIRDFYLENKNNIKNKEIKESPYALKKQNSQNTNQALALQNNKEQAQIVESVTRSVKGREVTELDLAESKMEGNESTMDLILPILIGFFIILVIPFILYQILRKKS